MRASAVAQQATPAPSSIPQPRSVKRCSRQPCRNKAQLAQRDSPPKSCRRPRLKFQPASSPKAFPARARPKDQAPLTRHFHPRLLKLAFIVWSRERPLARRRRTRSFSPSSWGRSARRQIRILRQGLMLATGNFCANFSSCTNH